MPLGAFLDVIGPSTMERLMIIALTSSKAFKLVTSIVFLRQTSNFYRSLALFYWQVLPACLPDSLCYFYSEIRRFCVLNFFVAQAWIGLNVSLYKCGGRKKLKGKKKNLAKVKKNIELKKDNDNHVQKYDISHKNYWQMNYNNEYIIITCTFLFGS